MGTTARAPTTTPRWAAAAAVALTVAAALGTGPPAGAAEDEEQPAGALDVMATDTSAWPEVTLTVAGPPPAPGAAGVEAYAVDRGGASVPVTVEAAGAREVALVLDTSGAAGDTGLRELRAAAVELVLSLEPGVRAAVVVPGGPQVVGPPAGDVASVVAALAGLPAPGPPDLAGDLAAAVAALDQGEGSPSAVVVLSARAGPAVEREVAALLAGVERPGLGVWVVHPDAGGGAAGGPLRVVDAAPAGMAATAAGVARDLSGLYVLRFRAGGGGGPVDVRLVEEGRTYGAGVTSLPGAAARAAAPGATREPGGGVRPRGLLAGLVGAVAVGLAGAELRRHRSGAVAGSAPVLFTSAPPAPTVAAPTVGAPTVAAPTVAGPAPPATALAGPAAAPGDARRGVPDPYAVARSPWAAPCFVAVLAGLAVATVPALDAARYADLLAALSGGGAASLGGPEPSLGLRPVLVLFLVLLGVFSAGPAHRRLAVAVTAPCLYLAAMVVCDVVMASAPTVLPPPLSPGGGATVSGLTGIAVLVVTVFLHHELPAAVDVERQVPPDRRRLATVALAVVFALAMAVAWSASFPGVRAGALGGPGLGAVVFACALYAVLAAVAAGPRRGRPRAAVRRRSGPSVAFLVPVRDAAADLGRCIEAIDAAAARSGVPCKVYVVDGGSTDGTAGIARSVLDRSPHLTGEVLDCPWRGRGRGHALDRVLLSVGEDVVVRVDAGTTVDHRLLTALVPWFADPLVGGVSGPVLAGPTGLPWLPPVRLVESVDGVAVLRAAQGGADAAAVVPGLVASYRTRVLRTVGGFGHGFDGEDADVTVRIGRAGYRLVTDPAVTATATAPRSPAELRDERRRWTRALFHVAARNVPAVRRGQGARGLVVVPASLLLLGGRALAVPVAVAAAAVAVADPGALDLGALAVAAAFLVAVRLAVTAVHLVAARRPGSIAHLPAYLAFRAFLSYVAFETLLTMRLRPGRRGGPAPPP